MSLDPVRVSTEEQLLEGYANWRRWTELEGAALQRADWPAVAKCQDAKQGLQPIILELRQNAESELQETGLDPAPLRRRIQVLVQDLIALETSNQAVLAAQRAAHGCRQKELTLTARNLSRVQRSYSLREKTNWHSYS